MVRTADVKRGWGKYFSKSCKAKEQEKRTGQNSAFHRWKLSQNESCNPYDCSDDGWGHPLASGYEGHGQD